MEYPKVYRRARIYLVIYAVVIGLSIYYRSILPLLFVGLTNLFGSWLLVIYGTTQHAGLAENVLDHRLNCRTVYMNPIHRYLYWNMNYHVEHHMFPLVPYHALPKLHAAVKDDCPTPYPSLFNAWREIVPAVLRQVKDPAYHVKRQLPEPKVRLQEGCRSSPARARCAKAGSKFAPRPICGRADVIRFDHGKRTYALYRDEEGKLYATDGFCTHGNTHLSDGLVKGKIIECSKHNGRFNLIDGSPARAPVCRGLATYPVEERTVESWSTSAVPAVPAPARKRHIGSAWSAIATSPPLSKNWFLNLRTRREKIVFTPGDYLQLDIPAFDDDPLPRFRHPPAVCRRLGKSAPFRSRGPQPRGRPAQQLLSRQQPGDGGHAALQRPHRDPATRPGLRSRRGFQLRLPASSPATSFPPSAPSAISISSRRNGRWCTSAGAPAWLRSAPTSRTCSKPSDCAQDQLLVWRALQAGDILRGLLSGSG